jgi:four helix bundle protein
MLCDVASKRYDLEPRLLSFSVAVCRIVEALPRTVIGRHAAGQLARSSTSPLANYAEAQAAESRRDFVHRLRICLKELRETLIWLRFIRLMGLSRGDPIDHATDECNELVAILATSVKTAMSGTANAGSVD